MTNDTMGPGGKDWLGPVIDKEVRVRATRDAVWQLWTTSEGAQRFLAPKAWIEPDLGGAFEIYFDPDADAGQRGSEGCRIHSISPQKKLVFQWNAPPHLEKVRDLRTLVHIDIADGNPGEMRVRLRHLGWGQEQEWLDAYDYFDKTWDTVLARMKHALEVDAVDWYK